MNDYRKLELQRNANHKKEEYKYFVGTTEKDPLSYAAGEKIVFKLRAKFMDGYLDVPFVKYSLLTEDGQSEEGIKACAEDGFFYIEGSISREGFVYLKAQACDEKKRPIADIEPFNGSAGADIDRIVSSTKMPADYADFWSSMKSAAEKTEHKVLFSKKIEDEKHAGFEMFDMHITAPGSEYASVSVAYPKDAKEGSLKFAMFFQGYSVLPTCPMPRDGYFTVSVNGHAMPNGESDAFYQELREHALKGYGYNAEENKRPETCYFAKMLLRDLAALYHFKDHALLNKKDYVFVGSSQGGMQACNMAAHFEKATAAILNVPWLADIYGDVLAGRRKNSMPKGDGLPYFDTAIAGSLLKCPALIISGLGDTTCNPCTQLALFHAIRSPKYIEFYQNKVHSCSIPWDNNVSAMGEKSVAELYADLSRMYYDWN